MSQRDRAIQIIESTYPVDSKQCSTAITGMRLLDQAKREVNNWRDLPDAVLQRYAELCIKEQQLAERDAERYRGYYSYGATFASKVANAIEGTEEQSCE